MAKSNDHQLRQILKKLTRQAWVLERRDLTIPDLLQELINTDAISLPFSPDSIWITYERMPVMGEMFRASFRSPLVKAILDRGMGDVAMVVDSMLQGSDAVRFAAVDSARSFAQTWIASLSQMDVLISPLPADGMFSIVSPLSAFVCQSHIDA